MCGPPQLVFAAAVGGADATRKQAAAKRAGRKAEELAGIKQREAVVHERAKTRLERENERRRIAAAQSIGVGFQGTGSGAKGPASLSSAVGTRGLIGR